MLEVSCQNFFFSLNNGFSNIAILYGHCILDISFIDCGGVSDKHCVLFFFFHLLRWKCRYLNALCDSVVSHLLDCAIATEV